ncbi:MAG: hypothetical protein ACLP9D_04450 [Candidatus Bathyarchaeia archaeon]
MTSVVEDVEVEMSKHQVMELKALTMERLNENEQEIDPTRN